MKSDDILLGIAIVAVVAAVLGVWVSYSYTNGTITGFATSQSNATVNLTVSAIVAINFTSNNINFGSSSVTLGFGNCTLNTAQGTNVGCGWAANNTGFTLENIGNEDITDLDIYTTKNATQFIGGTGPLYKLNISNKEVGSCVNATGSSLNVWNDVNTTSPGSTICTLFKANSTSDTIRIDLWITIPSDAPAATLGDTIVATATG